MPTENFSMEMSQSVQASNEEQSKIVAIQKELRFIIYIVIIIVNATAAIVCIYYDAIQLTYLIIVYLLSPCIYQAIMYSVNRDISMAFASLVGAAPFIELKNTNEDFSALEELEQIAFALFLLPLLVLYNSFLVFQFGCFAFPNSATERNDDIQAGSNLLAAVLVAMVITYLCFGLRMCLDLISDYPLYFPIGATQHIKSSRSLIYFASVISCYIADLQVRITVFCFMLQLLVGQTMFYIELTHVLVLISAGFSMFSFHAAEAVWNSFSLWLISPISAQLLHPDRQINHANAISSSRTFIQLRSLEYAALLGWVIGSPTPYNSLVPENRIRIMAVAMEILLLLVLPGIPGIIFLKKWATSNG